MRQSFISSDRTYGARRVWHEVLALDLRVWPAPHRASHARTGLACPAQTARTAAGQGHAQRHRRQNVLDRQFQAEAPNQRWLADFTYIWTAEGWLYVAVVLELYARRIVGWSMQERMTSQLVADALMMAIWRRGRPWELLHHADQGSQYASEHCQGLLKEHGITCSMSRAGEVWDNSAMESFSVH
ncbi:MAG: IS3 family transposase [Acidithiobacillus sp.]